MNQVSLKTLIIIGLTLFSMFFGAGNFIFPPYIGASAGNDTFIAILAFCATAVFFPILGIAAVAKSDGLYNLSARVSTKFAIIYSISLLLIIGPIFAIPRAANMPFEMTIKPFLPQSLIGAESLFIYSIIYFIINYLLCVNPSKMVELLGKFLTPILLLLIVILFFSAFVNPMHTGSFGQASGDWATSLITKGMLEGYQTMDALASLNFGIVILITYRKLGIKNESLVISSTIKAGIIAGLVLFIVYFMLGYIGASSASMFPNPENGAQILVNSTNYLFGKFGNIILGTSIGLACLTTTVGLICSISEFFVGITKIKYKTLVLIFCVLSSIIANLGLSAIIKYAVPFLYVIYPISIMFIIMSLLNDFLKSNKFIYSTVIYVTLIFSFLSTLIRQFGVDISFLSSTLSYIPFYENDMVWLIPSIIALVSSYIFAIKIKK